MQKGARLSGPALLKRLFSTAMARQLAVFPIPGVDVFNSSGIDLHRLEIEIAESPHHANVLLVGSGLSENMLQKAAIAFAQMPRPRSLMEIGAGDLSPLPEADIRVQPTHKEVESGFIELRQILKSKAWDSTAQAFSPSFLEDNEKPSDNHHKDHHSDNSHHKDQGEHHQDNGGGMSMKKMTRDLPKSEDGLPMDRSDVHFGPFHPGLPGGLDLHFRMDGDTVAKALSVEGINTLAESISEPARMVQMFPLERHFYQLLGKRAQGQPHELSLLMETEKNRILSHLNWLRSFAVLLGNKWLARQTNHFYFKVYFLPPSKLPPLLADLKNFNKKVKSLPILRFKLKGKGIIPQSNLSQLSGPVSRAAGLPHDLRVKDPFYQSIDFEPAVLSDNDCFARLQIRLQEIIQSLELIMKMQNMSAAKVEYQQDSRIESARGIAAITLAVQHPESFSLQLPSSLLAELIPILTEGHEISEALVNIASLDISPWQLQKLNWL